MVKSLDLFAGLDESAPAAARKGKAARKAPSDAPRRTQQAKAPGPAPTPAQSGDRRLHRARHRDSGGAGAGAPSARHVCGRHRPAGAASPARRADRQCDGRSHRRPCEPDRDRAPRRRLGVGQGQRPGHPGRSAPQIRERLGAGGDPHHAALGRQVRRQGVCDIGGAARRGPLGGQRALGGADGGGGTRPAPVAAALRARPAGKPAGGRRPRHQPARHAGALPSRRGHLRRRDALPAGAAARDGADARLSLSRRRDPLVL